MMMELDNGLPKFLNYRKNNNDIHSENDDIKDDYQQASPYYEHDEIEFNKEPDEESLRDLVKPLSQEFDDVDMTNENPSPEQKLQNDLGAIQEFNADIENNEEVVDNPSSLSQLFDKNTRNSEFPETRIMMHSKVSHLSQQSIKEVLLNGSSSVK